MDAEEFAGDAALFARLRDTWSQIDPVPADLVDRMVAAVAVADLSREYEMLTLVDTAAAAVRSESETTTLQFSDGTVNVLLHVSATADGRRRVDGWVDAVPLAIVLVQGESEMASESVENNRFAFDEVAPGLAHVRLVVRTGGDDVREFQTPQFEI
ncbi:hypothetical protein [Microbacterium sp. C7(2022)]|uniref:hypothetical protein n=1 Tax=Microbacterium sp. C7(2022) TaxID=2992759 RepID=UPI00237AEB47|nr:hypothetical protein [Microbacterium sp. C7(2022)]MDE0545247.1 hypothetical protein [Microbacterium sp. C7(2022)]